MPTTITNNYYNSSTQDINDPIVLVALKVALESYLYNFLFPNDTDRIIYSTTPFALQKRSSTSVWNNALLPFLNYREISIAPKSDRSWASFANLKHGVYIDELGMKVRFTPITLTFDATLWFATDRDCNIAYQRLCDDQSGETPINYSININGVAIPLYGLLSYTDLQYKPNFDENQWLLTNKISTISLGFEVQTILPMIRSKGGDYWLTEKVILDFYTKLSDNVTISTNEKYEAILNHFEQSEGDFVKV
jgi:hypothetical protein